MIFLTYVLGTRLVGCVDGHRGEYAATRFIHVGLMPLVPTRSLWIANGRELAIPLVWRSVAAGYLRWWAPVVAFLLLAMAPGFAATVAAVALTAVWLGSWRWRNRPARDHTEADLDFAALGLCCPPRLMGGLRVVVERAVAGAPDSALRPPEDVARDGAADPKEALVAYGRLRLASVTDPAAAALARSMLAGVDDRMQPDGPYRAGPALAAHLRGVIAELERDRTRAAVVDWERTGRRLVGLAGVATIAAGIFAFTARGSWVADDVYTLDPFNGDMRTVTLHCDVARDLIPVDRAGTVTVAICVIGEFSTFVAHPTSQPLGDTPTGWLDTGQGPAWLDRALDAAHAQGLGSASTWRYVDTTRDPLRGFRVLAIAAAIVAAGAWLVALHRKRAVDRLAAMI